MNLGKSIRHYDAPQQLHTTFRFSTFCKRYHTDESEDVLEETQYLTKSSSRTHKTNFPITLTSSHANLMVLIFFYLFISIDPYIRMWKIVIPRKNSTNVHIVKQQYTIS
jgi:diadenosine tetraphosphate (Ap4A) HIT family hydrolase